MLKTEKDCIKYTISIFSSNPYDFCDNINDVEKQYLLLKNLSIKHNINFEKYMLLYNKGKNLYETLEIKYQLNNIKNIDTNNINDNNLKKSLDSLNKTIQKLEFELTLLKKNNGDIENTSGMLKNKAYVDNLIKELKNASINQLLNMKNNIHILQGPFKPYYYSDKYLLKLLDKNILYKKRRDIYKQI